MKDRLKAIFGDDSLSDLRTVLKAGSKKKKKKTKKKGSIRKALAGMTAGGATARPTDAAALAFDRSKKKSSKKSSKKKKNKSSSSKKKKKGSLRKALAAMIDGEAKERSTDAAALAFDRKNASKKKKPVDAPPAAGAAAAAAAGNAEAKPVRVDAPTYLMKLPEFPPLDTKHETFVKWVTHAFARFKWAAPKLEDACSKKKGGDDRAVALSHTQQFIRHYLTPRTPHKGLLLVVSTGGGKTCTGVALTENFPRVIWVTKRNLINNIWRAMADDLCSQILREWKASGRAIPAELSERLRLLRDHGVNWIEPMTYRQFGNAVRPGKPTAMGEKLIKTSPKGAADPLAGALVVVDESHNLYDPKLPSYQRPNMKHIEAALDRSYSVSGKDSVKVLLMTATPGDLPEQVMGQLNLLIPKSRGKLPATRKAIMEHFIQPSGKPSGRLMNNLTQKVSGMVSYLNAMKDPSKFAQVEREETIKVTLSQVQEKAVAACLGQPLGLGRNGKPLTGSRKKPKDAGLCIRRRLITAERKAGETFDGAGFAPAALQKRLPEISPRMLALLDNIARLDKADRAKHGKVFKHVIFSDLRGGWGEKVVASALIASGRYNHIVKKKGSKLVLDPTPVAGKTNFAVLTTMSLYGGLPVTPKLAKDLIDGDVGLFNQPDNSHGKHCQILVINDDYQVGIDAFDVRYIHFVSPVLTDVTRTQVEGRGTRFCGSRGLPFEPGKGWVLHAFTYAGDWATPEGANKLGAGGTKTPFEVAKENLTGADVLALRFNNVLLNTLYRSAVDFNLNAAINGPIGVASLGRHD